MLLTFAEAHQMIYHFLVVICGTASLQQGCNLGAGLQIRWREQEEGSKQAGRSVREGGQKKKGIQRNSRKDKREDAQGEQANMMKRATQGGETYMMCMHIRFLRPP